MRAAGWMGIILVLVALVCVRSSAGQVQSTPGPGSGVVTVTGKVDVDNVVRVAPGADWKVSVSNVPDVRVANVPSVSLAALPFVKVGERYEVVWGPAERDTIRVTNAGSGGWVQVENASRPRWINLSLARAVEIVR